MYPLRLISYDLLNFALCLVVIFFICCKRSLFRGDGKFCCYLMLYIHIWRFRWVIQILSSQICWGMCQVDNTHPVQCWTNIFIQWWITDISILFLKYAQAMWGIELQTSVHPWASMCGLHASFIALQTSLVTGCLLSWLDFLLYSDFRDQWLLIS